MARKSNAGKAKKAWRVRTKSARIRRTRKSDPFEAFAAASARALSLPIEPAWRVGVRRNLRLILTHAALVDQFSLPEEIEPAPVFRA
jgi:hypothetical protein